MTTPQEPIGSGFGAASTAADVIRGIDLTGRTAIVTGGYSGLGLETVRVLRQTGAEVIVPARDVDRAGKAVAALDGVRVAPMDLLDQDSIDAFADTFLADGKPLHILVNSAGIMANPFTLDARGYESQFATNHLGHFQLTTRLLPALRQAQDARVVSVSSRGHRYSDVHLDDLHFAHREYEPLAAYGQSKTANILFAVALDEREQDNGVRAFSLHPGTIMTNLARYTNPETLRSAGVLDADGEPVIDPSQGLKTVEQGASTSVWCATSPRLDGLGGVYCENTDIAPVHSDDTELGELELSEGTHGVRPYAIEADAARRLWTVSEELLHRR